MRWSYKVLVEKTEAIIWLACEFDYHQEAFYIIQGERDKLRKLVAAMPAASLDITQYGKIILSDWGRLSNRHMKKLREIYGASVADKLRKVLEI